MGIISWIAVYGVMTVLVVLLVASLCVMDQMFAPFVAEAYEWWGGL